MEQFRLERSLLDDEERGQILTALQILDVVGGWVSCSLLARESSSDVSNSCAKIKVSLQTTDIKEQEVQNG